MGIQIGPVQLEAPVILAPMSGVTDMPIVIQVSGLNVSEGRSRPPPSARTQVRIR